MSQQLEKQFEIIEVIDEEDSNIYKIYLRGKKVYEWDDSRLINSPEDLVWLKKLFFDAVGIGLKLAMVLFSEHCKKLMEEVSPLKLTDEEIEKIIDTVMARETPNLFKLIKEKNQK
jgi:hypothetical protein